MPFSLSFAALGLKFGPLLLTFIVVYLGGSMTKLFLGLFFGSILGYPGYLMSFLVPGGNKYKS